MGVLTVKYVNMSILLIGLLLNKMTPLENVTGIANLDDLGLIGLMALALFYFYREINKKNEEIKKLQEKNEQLYEKMIDKV